MQIYICQGCPCPCRPRHRNQTECKYRDLFEEKKEPKQDEKKRPQRR